MGTGLRVRIDIRSIWPAGRESMWERTAEPTSPVPPVRMRCMGDDTFVSFPTLELELWSGLVDRGVAEIYWCSQERLYVELTSLLEAGGAPLFNPVPRTLA